MNKINCAITGATGFIGSHFIEHYLKNTDWNLIVLDKLSYASQGYDRIRDIGCYKENQDRVKFFSCDLTLPISDGIKQEIGNVDYIINLASESHVDNSISNPVPFIQNNVNLTLNLLEWARELKELKKFVQFSTDEVYSTAPVGTNYKEGDRHNPGNPYSASKSAQESICRAYSNTYKLPIIITNTMNVVGERQHMEKFVPMIIRKTLNGDVVTIHSNKDKTKAGSRFYIHARNVADAVLYLLNNNSELMDNIDASKGQFNIVGEKELDNLELAKIISSFTGKELKYEMVDFHSSRPGHDLRYGLNGDKLKSLGFNYHNNLEESLKKTVEWYLKDENKKWLYEKS